ncbi:MAG: T9SS type A sorting domain-containing protein [Bacteroidota bacterium]|nr:T9SS type A sorting domain-containing protein [Bacteroidota bacterium]
MHNQLTRSVAELRQILAHLYPHGASRYERVLWRVEATDGLTVTTSDPSELSQLPFYRLFFLDTETDASPAPRPATLTLHQNYPNPFNPTTTIRFALSHPMTISLIVTDAWGREVTALVESESLGSGEFTRVMDASGMPSGLYFYRLETEVGTFVKKMVLIR